MQNKLNILILPIALALVLVSGPVVASEVTGNLSTGISSTVGTTVDGTVISAPVASPAPGTYTSVQHVTLTATGSTSIRYTLDGTMPTCSSGTIYSAPVLVNKTGTIKAISCYGSTNSSSVASLAYTINLVVTPTDAGSLVTDNVFAPATGFTVNSTPSLVSNQQVTINIPVSGNNSQIIIPANTTITAVGGGNFDATALAASSVASGYLTGLGNGVVVDGAVQWGIVNLGLQFSNPITISIFVGTSFNGQTLNVVRSTSGSAGWTNDGIVSPATCLVSNGLCTFSATKASYYAATSQSVSGGGGGGGGGGGSPSDSSTARKIGDGNGDGKVNEYDFSMMMANWGKTGANVSDLNGDKMVNEYDFSMLMSNWSK